MTIFEAGIIAGVPFGAAVGGVVARSHGLLITIGSAFGGIIAGAVAGWIFAVVLICLLAIIAGLWRKIRKGVDELPSESDMKIMNAVAVRGIFLSAILAGATLIASGWLSSLITRTIAALITALLAVATSELRQNDQLT